MTNLSVSRHTILAGAAIAGALSQVRVAAAETADAAKVLTPATAVDVDSLPRVKVELVDPPLSTPTSRSRPAARRWSSSR